MEEPILVKYVATGSVTVTLRYGLAIVPKPAGMPLTPGKLAGKLTLTLAPA